MAPRYIIGVDGGGTGCRARLTDESGTEIASASAGPANISTDSASALKNIAAAIAEAYSTAGMPAATRHNDVAWLGLAGFGSKRIEATLNASLGFAKLRLSSDQDTLAEAVLGQNDGILALMGTGSFFMHRANGATRKVGGWGYQLGDEASGAWLGRALLRAVLHAHDGLIKESPLTRAVMARFAGTPRQIIDFAQQATPGEMGRFAPQIIQAHARQDPVATAILQSAIHEVCQTLERLDPSATSPVYLSGGLARAYYALLPNHIKPRCKLATRTALDGAISLARRHLLAAPETGPANAP